eukprot:Sspe_Gene.59316::Locus_32568_Transcript_1_1_Confidence_1.000_Length_1643::g.59316::m.59316
MDERQVEMMVGAGALVGLITAVIMGWKIAALLVAAGRGTWRYLTQERPKKKADPPRAGKKSKAESPKESKESHKQSGKAPEPTPEAPRKEEVKKVRQRVPTPSKEAVVLKGFKKDIECVAMSREAGCMFVAGSDRTYRLFKNKGLAESMTSTIVKLDKATVTKAAFDSTGTFLAVFVYNESKIKVLLVENVNFETQYTTLKEVWSCRIVNTGVSEISVGPGAGFVVVCQYDGTMVAFDRSGKEVGQLAITHQGAERQWVHSDDGRYIVYVGQMPTARIIAVVSGKSTTDDELLWAGVEVKAYDQGTDTWYNAKIHEVDTYGSYTIDWGDGTFGYCVAPCYVRATGVQMKGDDFRALKHAMTIRGHKRDVSCVSFSPNGELLVSCSEDGLVKVWNINVNWHQQADPKELYEFADTDHTLFVAAAVAPNNKLLCLAAEDGSLVFYRIDGKKAEFFGEISQAHSSPIEGVYFATGSCLVTTAGDDKCKVWPLPAAIPKPQFRK